MGGIKYDAYVLKYASEFNGSLKDYSDLIFQKEGLRIRENTLHYAVKRLLGDIAPPAKVKTAQPDKSVTTDKEGNVTIVIRKARTLDEWKDEAIVNMDEYEIDRVDSNQWEMGAIIDGEPIVTPLYQLKVTLKPKKPKGFNYAEVRDEFIKLANEYSPKYPNISFKHKIQKNLFVFDPGDSHFGKYCSFYETGTNFDLGMSSDRVREGCYSLGNKVKGFDIEKAVLIFGNDVLHFDNSMKTTTSGTRQDSDRMLTEVFLEAKKTFIEIIEWMRVTYPHVHIIFNCSNHDYMSGWMLMDSLASWFRLANNVTVDAGISHRKYFQYGQNLIATSHGDGAKESDIPMLMAQEASQMWADTKYRYAYLHHIHHKVRKHPYASRDQIGVTIEYLRSLSEADSWHHRNGYVGAPKAVEGFLHEFDGGQVGRFTHYF